MDIVFAKPKTSSIFKEDFSEEAWESQCNELGITDKADIEEIQSIYMTVTNIEINYE